MKKGTFLHSEVQQSGSLHIYKSLLPRQDRSLTEADEFRMMMSKVVLLSDVICELSPLERLSDGASVWVIVKNRN